MEARKRLRLKIAVASFAAIASVSMAVPALASANVVDDVLNSLGLGAPASAPSNSSSGSTKAGVPPSYVPPLHGTNPHGEGDAATVDLVPGSPNPVSGNPGQPELLVVGSSKGEQNADGTYHGHINMVSLAGMQILSVDSTPGQTNHSPTQPIQTAILTPICAATTICLGVLDADSSTTSTGSTNSFSAASLALGGATSPVPIGLNLGVAQSHGNISNDATCQTAHGDSQVASASVAVIPGTPITAGVSNATSESKACNNGTAPTVTQSGNVINLLGQPIPIPATGCDNTPASGTPNTNFTALNPLVSAVCNAQDSNSGQATAPYGVREALTVFALIAGIPTVKATTAGPESRAAAPPVTPSTTTPGAGNNNANNNNNGNGNGNGNGPGDGSTSTDASGGNGNGNLAFTGADLPWLAMLGLGLIGAGLALVALTPGARRPRLEA